MRKRLNFGVEAPFFGHLATADGLRIDSHKTQAIVSPPTRSLQISEESSSSTPVLRYYNLKEEVTLQCDASQSGLGAALLQGGQPVAYASKELTPTETRYTQIEKELLAIVFACGHFKAYIMAKGVCIIRRIINH